MQKEIVLAIIVGSFLGLFIAFGIWRANVALKSATSQNVTPTPGGSPTPQFGITLAKPGDKDVVTDSPQTFSGITSPYAWVVLSTDTDDYIFQAGSDGSFSQDVKLQSGVNQIILTAFTNTGDSASTSLIIVYSSEFAKVMQLGAATTGTTEADMNNSSAIRQKVIKKVEEVLKNPKAYIGTITDIAGGTIQIKTDGEIQQISVTSDKITVIKIGKVNKEIKLTDLAIGDFIVALGFKNGNRVLDARRILTMPPLTPANLETLYGPVAAIEKKDIIVKSLKTGQVSTVNIDRNTDISLQKGTKQTSTGLSDINEGDLVVAVVSKDTEKARTILVTAPAPSASPLPTSK